MSATVTIYAAPDSPEQQQAATYLREHGIEAQLADLADAGEPPLNFGRASMLVRVTWDGGQRADYWDGSPQDLAKSAAQILASEHVSEAATDVVRAREHLDAALAERDNAIRGALAVDTPYSGLIALTGLSRSALDTIRLGRRKR